MPSQKLDTKTLLMAILSTGAEEEECVAIPQGPCYISIQAQEQTFTLDDFYVLITAGVKASLWTATSETFTLTPEGYKLGTTINEALAAEHAR